MDANESGLLPPVQVFKKSVEVEVPLPTSLVPPTTMAAPSSSSSSPPKPTKWPSLKNAPVLGLAEGSSSFSNYHLAALVLGVPYVVKRILPLVNRGGFYTYWILVALLGVPITVGYWTLMSRLGSRVNERVSLPGKDIEEYIDIHDDDLKKLYHGKNKIPMQIFHDAYFDSKIDFRGKISFIRPMVMPWVELWLTRHLLLGDVLDVMEARHDWSHFHFTPELFKYVFLNLIPEVVVHSAAQDEEQVRDHYDRGDDFYSWCV